MRTLLVILVMLFVGCGTVPKGGDFTVENKTVRTENKPDGTTIITEETITATGGQPDNPNQPTELTFKDNHKQLDIKLPSVNTIKPPTPTQEGMKWVAIGAGAGILAGGVVAIFFGLPYGLTISGFSAATLVAVAAISSSAQYIGIAITGGVICLIIFGLIVLYRWWQDRKELNQTSKGIEEAKKDPELWGKLKNILEQTQDENVKKRIKNRK